MSKISNLRCDGGWYYGRQAFRDWLLDQADELLRRRGARRKNYHGSEVREHGDAEGLKREGLRPGALGSLAKGDPRNACIAAHVRSTTTVPLQWLAEQLQMETAANILHACRRYATD
jgi:hypothetical protein